MDKHMEDPNEVLPTSTVTDEEQEEKSSFWKEILDLFQTILIALLLYLAINAVSARIRVDGSSMEPTLHNGEFVMVSRLSYWWGEPQIGDVIVFKFPPDPEKEYIKRVIGLPGDSVKITGGVVYVNGEKLEEPYVAYHTSYSGQWQVPEGHLFVLGDNRNNSSDSHSWGTVPIENVVGKAIFIYWPPSEWGTIPHNVQIGSGNASNPYP